MFDNASSVKIKVNRMTKLMKIIEQTKQEIDNEFPTISEKAKMIILDKYLYKNIMK